MSAEDKKESGNTFLTDLRTIINEAQAANAMDNLAETVISRLIEQWGGQPVYILKNTSLRAELEERNRLIYQKFNGRNRHTICREFGISEVQLYKIINRIQKEMQRDLFSDDDKK